MTDQTGQVKQMVVFLENKKQEIAKVLPAGHNIEEFVKLAAVACADNPKLLQCTKLSIYRSLMQVCHAGLSLNPMMSEAYLIPYKSRDGLICTLQAGYRGLLKMAKASGEVRDIYAEVVCEGDTFRVVKGTSAPNIEHVYGDTRGFPTHVYAVTLFKDGYTRFEVMSWSEVEKAKAGAGGGSPAWKNYPGEMAKKVVIKRMCKTLPVGAALAAVGAIEDNASNGLFVDPNVDSLDDILEAAVVDAPVDAGEVPMVPESLGVGENLKEQLRVN